MFTHLTHRLPLLLTSCFLTWLGASGCSSPVEPTDGGCTLDVDCDEGSICVASTSVCTVEPRLCESSTDCEEPREFCIPRDELNPDSLICERVVRCDRVEASDVSALCRLNNALTGNEQFACDVANPDTPTCVRSDNPGGTGSPCAQSEECKIEGDQCLYGGSPQAQSVCGPPTTCGDILPEQRDAYCAALTPDTTCKQSPMRGFTCQPEFDEVYDWIWILDRTVETEACESAEPGADLMGVRVLDVNDNIIGWGSAYYPAPGDSGTQDNMYATPERINGNANGFANQICPDLDTPFSALSPPPMSLGCGGSVFVVFFDLDGRPITLQENMTVEVLEYGDPCDDPNRDVYSVYLCRDSWSAEQGISESCIVAQGGTQRGFSQLSVAFPR